MFNIPRVTAFLVHLAISFVIFLLLAYLIIFHWYPLPYFHTDGGWRGIRIIAGVDLVLGPLLTLIVFKPGKPGLKFDLTMIALAQAAALTWGIWVTYTGRPIALVYTVNYLTPVSVKLYNEIEFPLKKFALYGNKTPVPVYADLPHDPVQFHKYLKESVSSGTALFLFTDLYKKFDSESMRIVKQNSDKLLNYLKADPEGAQLLNEFSQDHGENNHGYLYIPLHSRQQRLVLVLDVTTLSHKGTLDIDVTEFVLGIAKQKNPESAKAQTN